MRRCPGCGLDAKLDDSPGSLCPACLIEGGWCPACGMSKVEDESRGVCPVCALEGKGRGLEGNDAGLSDSTRRRSRPG